MLARWVCFLTEGGTADARDYRDLVQVQRLAMPVPAIDCEREPQRGGGWHSGTIRFPKMEPESRPEWASPIEVGVHARSFYSALPERTTRGVLRALRDDPELLSFLGRHGLGRLEFSSQVPKPNWLGFYDANSRDLVVNSARSPETYGKEFHPPELASVSAAGSNLVEAMQRSLYHEIGHHILENLPAQILDRIATQSRSRRAAPVSIRARGNPLDYFSETFSAYRFEDSLADRDPTGYDIVEAILRVAWNR
jgi:hypothetical protein